MIEKGLDYAQLKKSYIIFICNFDLFGKGRHIYHFENLCREDPSVRLNDGTEKIFLNTKGTMDDVDEELHSLLDYFESLVPQDAFTGQLDEAVTEARLHKEWRREYMKIEMMMRDSRKEGRAEGRKVEREEGIEKLIQTVRDIGASKLTAFEQLVQKYSLSENEANEKIGMYWTE